jgi:hypothetical protein
MDGNQILPCYETLASLYVCGERFLNRPLQSAIKSRSFDCSPLPIRIRSFGLRLTIL